MILGIFAIIFAISAIPIGDEGDEVLADAGEILSNFVVVPIFKDQ